MEVTVFSILKKKNKTVRYLHSCPELLCGTTLALRDRSKKWHYAETIEESIKSFEENEKLFGGDNPVKISFSEDLINELSNHWEMSKEKVLSKLKKGLK